MLPTLICKGEKSVTQLSCAVTENFGLLMCALILVSRGGRLEIASFLLWAHATSPHMNAFGRVKACFLFFFILLISRLVGNNSFYISNIYIYIYM